MTADCDKKTSEAICLSISVPYACAWCEIKDGQLTLIPHPDSGEQTRTFRHPSEVEVASRTASMRRFCVRVGGGIALAYNVQTPMLALNLGATAPLVISALSKKQPTT